MKLKLFLAGWYQGRRGRNQTGSKSANGEDNIVGGGDARVGENEDDEEDDDDNEDQGVGAEKRKKHICDEMEYDDGMEKKTSIVVDQLDGEYQSGFESEVDQAEVEAEEDFEVGGDDAGSVADEKALEDDSGTLPDEETSVSPYRTEPSSATKASKSKAKKPKVSRRKKMKRAIFVEAKGLKFEAHFVLSDKHLILLAEVFANCFFQTRNIMLHFLQLAHNTFAINFNSKCTLQHICFDSFLLFLEVAHNMFVVAFNSENITSCWRLNLLTELSPNPITVKEHMACFT